jgi:hypothetical protein
VRRAIRWARADGRPHILADAKIDELLDVPIEMVLTDQLRRVAATLDPDELRTLDAIHVACAFALGSDLAALVTYDTRMQTTAEIQASRSLPLAHGCLPATSSARLRGVQASVFCDTPKAAFIAAIARPSTLPWR